MPRKRKISPLEKARQKTPKHYNKRNSSAYTRGEMEGDSEEEIDLKNLVKAEPIEVTSGGYDESDQQSEDEMMNNENVKEENVSDSDDTLPVAPVRNPRAVSVSVPPVRISISRTKLNFKQLCRMIDNEETAVQFFQEKHILPVEMSCENGHKMVLRIKGKSRFTWRCNVASCRKEMGIRVGTWFNGSKLQFETAAYFIYSWAHQLSSIKFCERELEMNKNTVVDWNNYIRDVCSWRMQQNATMIGGPELVVEINLSLYENVFPNTKKNRSSKKVPSEPPVTQWIFGGICLETKECFLKIVSDRTPASLMSLIEKWVRPGSTIISEEWEAYTEIQGVGRTFETLDLRFKFVHPKSRARTQDVDILWRSLKSQNKKHCGTHSKHVESYFAEYMWRSRLKEKDHFDTILKDISSFKGDVELIRKST